ncbi:MFS transporter [Kribbella sp. NPDC048915]|uniref:MFS transporter n=1 Tax=Kribbella sp. NPDC048915 TaxID=3155148 RepID=UPI0033C78BE9
MDIPVRRLWLAVLCGYLAFGATLQVLPMYVPATFGGGAAASGTAVGIAFLATACARPFAGWLADAGWSRPVVLTGGVLAAIGGLGQLFAPQLSVLLVARLVMGAGEAALFSAALPWVLTGARVGRRGQLAGWFGLSMWGGLAGGPVLATALVRLVGGVEVVWWVVVALCLAPVVLVATTRSDPGRSEPLARVRALRDLVPSGVQLPGAIIGLAAYCYGTVAALLVLRSAHLWIADYALTVFAVAFLLLRFAGSPLVDRFGGRLVALATAAVEIVALLGIALADDPAMVLGCTALAGFGMALVYPAGVSMTLDRVRGQRPGLSMGVMTSFWDLGVLVAGPLGGLIAERSGFPAAFLVAAAAGLASVGVLLRMPRRARSPR